MKKLLPLYLMCAALGANASNIHIPVSVANGGVIEANDQILVSVNMPSCGFNQHCFGYNNNKLDGNITCTMLTNSNSKPLQISSLSDFHMSGLEYHDAIYEEEASANLEPLGKISTTFQANIWWNTSNENSSIDLVIKNADSANTARISCDATVNENQYRDMQ